MKNKMTNDSLINFVRENSLNGSLREIFVNYFVNHNQTNLPLDNTECRKLITKSMDLYFKLKDLDYKG